MNQQVFSITKMILVTQYVLLIMLKRHFIRLLLKVKWPIKGSNEFKHMKRLINHWCELTTEYEEYQKLQLSTLVRYQHSNTLCKISSNYRYPINIEIFFPISHTPTVQWVSALLIGCDIWMILSCRCFVSGVDSSIAFCWNLVESG